MESENSLHAVKCCKCGCTCSTMNRSLSGTYIRTVKRKLDELEEEENKFTIPGFVLPQNENARVEIGNECVALREMVSSQQETIQELVLELEEERNASASATNEAMSMILRLQREKAEIQMELRQFKRYAEEKMAHDQQETVALDDLLYKREQTIQSLTCEVQAYKHRMMSYGLIEGGSDGLRGMSRNSSMTENIDGQFEFPPYEIYPPLRCNTIASHAYADDEDNDYEEESDMENYAFGGTPRPNGRLKDLESRINQLEKSPRVVKPDGELSSAKSVFEKVIVGQSPRRAKHLRKISTDSSNSVSAYREMGPDLATDAPNFGNSFKKTEFSVAQENSNLKKVDNVSGGGDEMSDRVYTMDSVHQGASVNGVMDPKASVGIGYDESPRESIEIQKLYARLHALEADRESMRQAIVSIGTDKAQLLLLKEIAQNLCKEMSPARTMPVKKQLPVRSFSCFAVFKWIVPFVLWRRTAIRSKYTFGLSEDNAGLLMLLDRGPRIGHLRYISRVQI